MEGHASSLRLQPIWEVNTHRVAETLNSGYRKRTVFGSERYFLHFEDAMKRNVDAARGMGTDEKSEADAKPLVSGNEQAASAGVTLQKCWGP
jgi:hypothetical protein